MKVKVVKVCNEKQHTLLFKENFDSDFKEISVQRTVTKHDRPTSELSEKIIKQKYSARLRVSDEKKKDLISFVSPLHFHFNIMHTTKIFHRVNLPEIEWLCLM